MTKHDQEFWNERYRSGEMGWDIGHVSTPIKNFVDGLSDKDLKILIPGCGNAYEAEYLLQQGFSNVNIIDISELALHSFRKRCPDFPESHIIHADFFKLDQQFDLIIEQTFFCALEPVQREDYVAKMATLLKLKGRLAGLLFDIPFNLDGPPYGGNKEMYLPLFESSFDVMRMEPALDSIAPRAGRELFIELRVKG